MARLSDILYKVSLKSTLGNMDVEVDNIVFDSRLVGPGSLFIATRGTVSDGHSFIDAAIDKGAVAIIAETEPAVVRLGTTYVVVGDSSEALGLCASNFYGNPSRKMKLVGVTGTNGKTTTVTLLHKLFMSLGYKVGLLSTVENKINEQVIPSTHTTPDAVTLNKLLARMLEEGCTHVFMEVSSHAVVQRRIAGLRFTGAIFTNITHDHLDYHKTFDEYIKAKKMFFDGLDSEAFALVNKDDKRGAVMLQNTKARKYFFSLDSMADFKARLITNTYHGLEMEISNRNIWFKLIGSFNAYNLLGVFATAMLLEEEEEEVLTQLSSQSSARGRFEQYLSDQKITAIVDYAHTPDALKNVLDTISDLRNGNEKVITVVGCGGNRDATKRPVMAEIACQMSDRVILTSDNPRDEEPQDILDQMLKGVKTTEMKKVLSILDRKEAIKTAVALAEPGDVILIAGKGHETYQEVKGVKHSFDDREVVLEMFRVLGK